MGLGEEEIGELGFSSLALYLGFWGRGTSLHKLQASGALDCFFSQELRASGFLSCCSVGFWA